MYLLLQHCSIIKKAFFHTNQNKEICSQSLSLRYKWLRSYIFMSIRSMHCELSPFWITYISYVGLKIVGWCWTKWSPTFTAKRICKFLPNGPLHIYFALVDVFMFVYRALLRAAPTCKNHATAPEWQPPACCFLPAIWHWPGSWVTPMRRLPNRYVTERNLVRKGGMVTFWAGSIN